jgi:transcriptional regulator with XRE-family HTH domain
VQIGRRVAALRAGYGESLREAAVRTGVSHTTIARIENGKISRSMHCTLCKIAAGYHVSAEYLLIDLTATDGRVPPPKQQIALLSLEGSAAASEFSIYARLMRKAITAGIEPEVLDLAIDILDRKRGACAS